MIHQELLVVPELTVAQNIFLGRETNYRSWLNDKIINQKAQELLDSIGVHINAQTKIKNLSIAEMQMVEIAKAISNNAKVIIMDEPTSALSDKEVAMLFKIIKDLKDKGVAIITVPETQGAFSLQYTAEDSRGAQSVGTVQVIVDPNAPLQPPIAMDDRVGLDQLDNEGSVDVDVLANDTDVDSPVLELVAVSGTSDVQASLNADGTVTLTPSRGSPGSCR